MVNHPPGSPDSRRNERLLIDAPTLRLQFSVPAVCLEDPPECTGDSGRLPKKWVEENLHLAPLGGDVSGVSIHVSRLPPRLKERAEAWDGVAVQARGRPPRSLTKESKARITADPESSFLSHEDGQVYLLSPRARSAPEFETPPRPQLESQAEDPESRNARQRPTAEEIVDVYQAWRSEGLALTASALDLSEEEVSMALAECSPPLPPPIGPPPGLPDSLTKSDPFGSGASLRTENPLLQRTFRQAPASSPGTGLIQALGDRRQSNPLLQGSQVILSQPSAPSDSANAGRIFHVSSLFPSAEPRAGNMAQHYRKTGALFSDALGAAPGNAVTADRFIHAIDGPRKAQDEDKTGTKGVVSALKEPEKLDVFLARGCGETQVELCPGVYGKELFHGIKRAGHHAKHMLNLIKWPVLISNRLALAIAGLWWGGEESYTLLASDCPTAKPEQVEAWTPPTEHKVEARVKAPAAFLTWLRYAENAVKVFGSAYGLEHVPERLAFLAALREANEEDENAFPVAYCIKLYEELNAVWCEQIRESRRRLCSTLGTKNPRLEDIKMVALSPGPDGKPAFQFPRVWDLQDPEGYYQQVILPRQQRAMTRLPGRVNRLLKPNRLLSVIGFSVVVEKKIHNVSLKYHTS